jgi:hypothetical protein
LLITFRRGAFSRSIAVVAADGAVDVADDRQQVGFFEALVDGRHDHAAASGFELGAEAVDERDHVRRGQKDIEFCFHAADLLCCWIA